MAAVAVACTLGMSRPHSQSLVDAAKLDALTTDRPAIAPLLVKPSGGPWKKSDHARLFRRVAEAAEQDPAEVTIYALRHSNIVRQILAGVPIRVVAVNHDTSVAMIEKHYARYIVGDPSDAMTRRTLIDFGRDLNSETDLRAMLSAVVERISSTLLVDRLAVFRSTSREILQ